MQKSSMAEQRTETRKETRTETRKEKRILPLCRALAAGALLSLIAGCAEYLPISSGALTGEVAALPASWSEVAQADIVQLETNPTEPYSVNLWVIGEGERLYVFAGANYTTWVEYIDANPHVRLRIGSSIYELQAERVTDKGEMAWFAERWDAKYGNRPRNENVAETWLMRLTPR